MSWPYNVPVWYMKIDHRKIIFHKLQPLTMMLYSFEDDLIVAEADCGKSMNKEFNNLNLLL